MKSIFRKKGKQNQKKTKSRDWINNCIRQFIGPLSIFINWVLKSQKIFVIYRVSKSIGDQVCMSAAIKLIKEQYNFKVIVISSMSKIFNYNPNVWINVSLDVVPRWFVRSFLFWLDNLGGYGQIEKFMFKNVNELSYEDYMRSTKTTMHMVEAHSRHFILPLKYENIRCEMFFHDKELERLREVFSLPKKYAVIQSEGNKSYTPNKEWSVENFQEIIDRAADIEWVQIGLEKDKKLSGVLDLSGKTLNIRQLAYIIYKAEFIVCLEGLYNHIATAVNTPSYVIFSGFLPVELAKYSTTIPLVCSPQVTCSPCWLDEFCPVEGRPCMSAVTPQLVVEKISSNSCISA